MASVDPYSPCPCGSGQKFKWCCHKVEAYADRAMRLFETGQIDSALAALDEGLRKEPGNAWLTTRKALILARKGELKPATELLRNLLAKNPGHVGASGLLIRLTIETEGLEPAIALFQQTLAQCSDADRAGLALSARLIGTVLAEGGDPPAAREFLILSAQLSGDLEDPAIHSLMRSIDAAANVSPWLRNPYEPAEAPEGLSADDADRFAAALEYVGSGRWSSAAAAFEMLAADGIAVAERNLGLCRLWLLDDHAAVDALRRYIRQVGETTEAVDLEALSQNLEPSRPEDLVDQVRLIWNLRDRDGLLRTFQGRSEVAAAGAEPLDPRNPESPEVDVFLLLDRPAPTDAPKSLADVPEVVGRVLVGRETVLLETYDDGRVDDLRNRLFDLADPAIPRAHPKTKVVGKADRTALALSTEWHLPESTDPETAKRIRAEARARIVNDVWPKTPQRYLKGRTPLQAAAAGDAKLALRAAVLQLEFGHGFWRDAIDFDGLRAKLNIAPEPTIDPDSVDIDATHIGRLERVPASRLDDDRLLRLYDRARQFLLPLALENAVLALMERPEALAKIPSGHYSVYADMANLAVSRQDLAGGLEWAAKGRQADPEGRTANAARWDMLEIRLRARGNAAPEEWVRDLAVVLERYRDDRAANELLMSGLVEMGLVRLYPHPEDPDKIVFDSRMLQAVMAQYGPRVMTAGGDLGVAAAKGAIWTPESGKPAGGSTTAGGIWTPGSTAAPAAPAGGDKPRLIIPGR